MDNHEHDEGIRAGREARDAIAADRSVRSGSRLEAALHRYLGAARYHEKQASKTDDKRPGS